MQQHHAGMRFGCIRAAGAAGQRELAGLQAHQRRQRQQHVTEQLHAVAAVEQQVGQHRPRQIQQRAQRKVQRAGQRRAEVVADPCARAVAASGQREHHRKHQRDSHRRTALAPRHPQEDKKRRRHQQQPQCQRVVLPILHGKKQRRAQQRRGQHVPKLAAPGRWHIGRARDDDAHRRRRRGKRAQPPMHAGRNHQQPQRHAEAIEHVMAQRHAQQTAQAKGRVKQHGGVRKSKRFAENRAVTSIE